MSAGNDKPDPQQTISATSSSIPQPPATESTVKPLQAEPPMYSDLRVHLLVKGILLNKGIGTMKEYICQEFYRKYGIRPVKEDIYLKKNANGSVTAYVGFRYDYEAYKVLTSGARLELPLVAQKGENGVPQCEITDLFRLLLEKNEEKVKDELLKLGHSLDEAKPQQERQTRHEYQRRGEGRSGLYHEYRRRSRSYSRHNRRSHSRYSREYKRSSRSPSRGHDRDGRTYSRSRHRSRTPDSRYRSRERERESYSRREYPRHEEYSPRPYDAPKDYTRRYEYREERAIEPKGYRERMRSHSRSPPRPREYRSEREYRPGYMKYSPKRAVYEPSEHHGPDRKQEPRYVSPVPKKPEYVPHEETKSVYCYFVGVPKDTDERQIKEEFDKRRLSCPKKIEFVQSGIAYYLRSKLEDRKGNRCYYMKIMLERREDVDRLLAEGFEIFSRPVLIILARDDVFYELNQIVA